MNQWGVDVTDMNHSRAELSFLMCDQKIVMRDYISVIKIIETDNK